MYSSPATPAGTGCSACVEHIAPGCSRSAGRSAALPAGCSASDRRRRPDRGLGRPVQVGHRRAAPRPARPPARPGSASPPHEHAHDRSEPGTARTDHGLPQARRGCTSDASDSAIDPAQPAQGPCTRSRSASDHTAAPVSSGTKISNAGDVEPDVVTANSRSAGPSSNRSCIAARKLPSASPRDHHTLRPSGRPRRVDHVRRVRHRRLGHQLAWDHVRVRMPGQLRDDRRLVEQHHRGVTRGQPACQLGAGHHEDRSRVGEHERDPLGRVLRVHRQVRGARLRHREQRHDQVHAIGAAPPPPAAPDRRRARPATAPAGSPARSAPRTTRLRAGDHRGRVRVRPACASNRSGTRAAGTSRAVSFQSTSSRSRSAGSRTSRRPTAFVRIADRAVSSRTNQPGDRLGRAPVEQVGAVLEGGTQPSWFTLGATLLVQVEQQVELGDAETVLLPLCDDLRQFDGRVQCRPLFDVVPAEHHLEQRVPGQRPRPG